MRDRVEELAFRESGGIAVSLLWTRGSGQVQVAVHDRKRGTSFNLAVCAGQSPLDVFHHPYAYVGDRQIETGPIPVPSGGYWNYPDVAESEGAGPW